MKPDYLSAEERVLFTAYKRMENGKEAIFIHIPKTAGTSIRHTLEFPRPSHSNFRFEKHYRLKAIEEQLGSECLQRAFIFAFARNPWDRLYSAYLFRRREILEGKAPKAGPAEKSNINDFETWVKFLSGLKFPVKGTLTIPQLGWITNKEEEVPLDYIGRYENLNEDYAKICQILGLKPKLLLQVNISSKQGHNYRTVYSDYSRDFVAEYYKHDIEYFDYRF